jgi:hypothetical protein
MKTSRIIKKNPNLKIIPAFYNYRELTNDQINDPDFRLKQFEKLYSKTFFISCSKCHHCR